MAIVLKRENKKADVKLGPLCIASESVKCWSPVENSTEFLQKKLNIELPYDPTIPLLGK